MTKAELIAKIRENADISTSQAEIALETVSNSIVDALKAEGRAQIYQIGSLTVAQREARTARNPRTGETLSVPAKKAVKFSAAKSLKEALN